MFSASPQLDLISLLTGGENNVTHIRDFNAGKVQTQRIRCHRLQQLKWWDGGGDFKACVINAHVFVPELKLQHTEGEMNQNEHWFNPNNRNSDRFYYFFFDCLDPIQVEVR